MSGLRQWIGQLPNNSREYKTGQVAYITKYEGGYTCLLCSTPFMRSCNAKQHFNGARHIKNYNKARALEANEKQIQAEGDAGIKFQERVKAFDRLQKLAIRYNTYHGRWKS
jgi:hypothetical protein